MSRIEEAIRRSKVNGAISQPGPDQKAFLPAWPVSAREDGLDPPSAPAVSEMPADPEHLLEAGSVESRLSISSAWRDRLAIGNEADPAMVEQFRRLAATLHQAHQAQGLRSVMVTSASPGDGKTLTAINLALVLAESYRYRVLLVDADLRRPSITNLVDLADGTGLSDALRASTPQKLALAQLTPRLTLLPAGRPTMNSIEALVSPRMGQILEEALARFDWVILDAPPVGPTTDARLLCQMAGGTLFVIRAAKSQYPEVLEAIDVVGRDQILGVVLNGVESGPAEGYYYAYGSPDDKS